MATDYTDKDYNDIRSTEKREAEQIDNWSIPVQTSQQCVTLSFSESPVFFTTSVAGLIPLHPHPNVSKNHTVLTAQGIMEVIPNKLFHVLKGNSSPQPIHMTKRFMSQLRHLLRLHYAAPLLQHPGKPRRREVKGSNQDKKLEHRQCRADIRNKCDRHSGNRQKYGNAATQEHGMYRHRATKVLLDRRSRI